MNGADRAEQKVLSRRLPPLEAWRQPDKWLDLSTGRLRRDKRNQPHPVDSRGLVNIQDVIDELKDLFWSDFALDYDPSHPELKSDNHHIYFTKSDYRPINNDDSLIPYFFREEPSNLAHIHRQVHNAWHDLFDKPAKPPQRLMKEEIEQRGVARDALINLVRAAKHTTEFYSAFPMRRDDIARHPERISYRENDTIAEEYLRNKFKARYSYYRSALEEFRDTPQRSVVYPDLMEIGDKPKVVAAKLGALATRHSINFLPHFSMKAA
jgi:hypothetical protein